MATDILLINLPPYESYYSRGVPHLGLLYVATSLRHHGYAVGYLDCAQVPTPLSQILAAIEEAQPRLVGVSVDTDNVASAGYFSRELKREFGEGLFIVFGGPASRGRAEETMKHSAADVLVIGEGEYAVREVADFLLRGQGQLKDIQGICYRSAHGLELTPPRPVIADLDGVPIPDRNFLPADRRYEASLITGRGCPFRCTFCFEGRSDTRYRHRSPENVLEEIDYLIDFYDRPFISINDDTFISDPAYVRQICRLLGQRYRPWKDYLLFCEVRVDIIDQHPDLVDVLIEAGVARIQIGVESADHRVLKAYRRPNVDPETVERVVRMFHDAGIPSIYCGFIVGGPHETRDTIETSLDFARHLLLDVAPGSFECSVSFLTPLPGTDIWTNPEKFELRLLDPDLVTSTNFNFCVTQSRELDAGEITNLRMHFLESIEEAMREVVPTLGSKVVRAHFRLSLDFNVATHYYNHLSSFRRVADYFDAVGDGKFAPAHELTDEKILSRFPTRLPTPMRVDDGKTTITGGPSDVRLNRFGSRVYAYCSGKLTGEQIVDELIRELGERAPSRERLRSDLTKFIRRMDEQYAVFLKDY